MSEFLAGKNQDQISSESVAYLSSILNGDSKKAIEISKQFLDAGHNFLQLYEEVLKPSLYEVGRLWEVNKISVATEHLATAITERVLNSIYQQIIPEFYIGKKVLGVCVENEDHYVGIKMVSDLFEKHGWDSYLIGPGIPTPELIRYIHKNEPNILAISISVFYNFSKLELMLSELTLKFPNLRILVGGQALKYIDEQVLKKWENVKIIRDLIELECFIIGENEKL